MSTTETPAPPATVERACPRCGEGLAPEQEWCLNCGAAVGTRVAEPRGWRVPVAVIGALLAIALAALVLALVELAGPAEKVTEVPAGQPTPAPAAATPTPAPEAAVPTTEPGPGQDVQIATWPDGERAWTLVLNSSGTRADANRLAREVGAKGVPVGVLDSNDFESLGPDSWVVFSGQYPTREEAESALAGIRQQAGGGSPREIVPKAG